MSKYTGSNIKFGVNRTFHVFQIPVFRFGLYRIYKFLWKTLQKSLNIILNKFESYRPVFSRVESRCCASIQVIFSNHTWSQYTSLNSECAQTPVFLFDLYRRYKFLWKKIKKSLTIIFNKLECYSRVFSSIESPILNSKKIVCMFSFQECFGGFGRYGRYWGYTIY